MPKFEVLNYFSFIQILTVYVLLKLSHECSLVILRKIIYKSKSFDWVYVIASCVIYTLTIQAF